MANASAIHGDVALLALGSNLGDRRATLQAAVDDLRSTAGIEVLRVSSFIETEPVGMIGQPPFLNGAALIRTTLSPRALLERCLAIECAHGRERRAPGIARHESRTLDIDLLLFGDQVVDNTGLHIPHPRLHQRFFALAPAVQIAGDMRHPVLNDTLGGLLARLNAKHLGDSRHPA